MKLSTVDFEGNANWIEGGLDAFEVVDSMATGISISNMNQDIIRVHPNPFSNEENISYHFNNLSSDARIEVYDLFGNKLESFPVTTSNGSISFGKNLLAGVYFVHLVENNRTLGVVKVVKQL